VIKKSPVKNSKGDLSTHRLHQLRNCCIMYVINTVERLKPFGGLDNVLGRLKPPKSPPISTYARGLAFWYQIITPSLIIHQLLVYRKNHKNY